MHNEVIVKVKSKKHGGDLDSQQACMLLKVLI